jgi:hypothetical protein
MAAATRSTVEWAASDNIPREPVRTPVRNLRTVIPSAAKTENRAAERFSLDVERTFSDGTAELIYS